MNSSVGRLKRSGKNGVPRARRLHCLALSLCPRRNRFHLLGLLCKLHKEHKRLQTKGVPPNFSEKETRMNIKCIGTDRAISPTLRAYAERVLRAALHNLRRDLLCATVRFVACDGASPREGRNCQIAVDDRAARTIVVEASADNFYAALHDAVARLDSTLLQERAPNQFFTTHPPRETRSSGSPLSRPHSRTFSAGGQKTQATMV